MTIDAWRATCNGVRVGGALPMSLSMTEDVEGDWYLRIEMSVPDINTDETIVIHASWRIDTEATEADRLDMIRDCIHAMYKHEADEQIRIGNHRPFSPFHQHAQERRS